MSMARGGLEKTVVATQLVVGYNLSGTNDECAPVRAGRVVKPPCNGGNGGAGGRQPGKKYYTAQKLDDLLRIIQDIEPIGANMWCSVW